MSVRLYYTKLRPFWAYRRDEALETQWLPFTEVKDLAEAARLILG